MKQFAFVCFENTNYYTSAKICRENCSDSTYDNYVNKHDISGDPAYSTYECVDTCTEELFYTNSNDDKICTDTNACPENYPNYLTNDGEYN